MPNTTAPVGPSRKRPKCARHFELEELPWTDKQRQLLSRYTPGLRCMIIRGYAGTSKTLMAVRGALEMVSHGWIDNITYIRPAVESSARSIGHLPGDIEEKLGPYMVPFQEKLSELVTPEVLGKLRAHNQLHACSINFLRGCQFDRTAVIIDEAQSCTLRELVTVITRLGRDSRVFICGDPMQSDIRNSGLDILVDMFDTAASRAHGIETFEFTSDDIMRSPFVKHVITTLIDHGHGAQLA